MPVIAKMLRPGLHVLLAIIASEGALGAEGPMSIASVHLTA